VVARVGLEPEGKAPKLPLGHHSL